MASAPESEPFGVARPLAEEPGLVPSPPDGPDALPDVPRTHALLAGYADRPPLSVLRGLETSARGLTESDAEDRLLRQEAAPADGGPGRAATLRHLARLAADPFVLVLVLLSAVTAVTRDPRGAVLIGSLAVLSCLLRMRQERRGGRAAAELRALTTTTATVLRRADSGSAGVEREVPVEQVVPGDVVRLAPGDMVPADLRLLSATGLRVDQAVLTGESLPAPKRAAWTAQSPPPEPDVPLFDRPELCLMGTSVVSGTGTAVAVATGPRTHFAALQRDVPRAAPETAFDRGVRAVSWALIAMVAAAVPVALLFTEPGRTPWSHALLFAVSIAVALTPEMLPLVVTTTLARGAATLTRDGVIVKRLPAVHDLGAMNTLCADKTGTLTLDRLSLTSFLDASGEPSDEVLRWARLNAWFATELVPEAAGDTMDDALLDDTDPPEDGFHAVDAVPFDSDRRRATVVLRQDGRLGRDLLVTKGAVEDVLPLCDRVRTAPAPAPVPALGAATAVFAAGAERDGFADPPPTSADAPPTFTDVPLTPDERDRLAALTDERSATGERLLAVAVADRPAARRDYAPGDERGLTLVGFVGFRDEPDPSAPAALERLAGLGVALVVVTGDHPLVAVRTCRDAGLTPGRVVLGAELADLPDAELDALITPPDGTTPVFARVDPRQKARVVGALRRAGRTVGFLGDGINDAPALRAADVGISVTGAVDLARESSDVVLAGRDLSVLAHGITEGRRTFGNGVKYIRIAVTSNLGNVASMLAASVLLPFMPLLPLQVLAQNLLFDLSQLSLARDRVDPADLRGPRTFDLRDLARFAAVFGPLGALFDLIAFGLYWWLLEARTGAGGEALFHTGFLVENLLAQALMLLVLRGRGRGRGSPRASRTVVTAAWLLAVTAVLLPLSPLAGPLGLVPLPMAAVPVLAIVLAGYGAALVFVRNRYLKAA
ncbi:HAD-IC family P-type ATPase [Actinomadura rupiterrae]|uniref:HAD-IC family P-type ATPase n=1 Tax=Actinomadura rupiterrae TaxID=559627 RepID=UPI0027E2E741|nr:HAD-IC family P-type ATPase [Actinomadura rupiterrae]MCP2336832.1 Mg2+-importing ATPase [Actinomadura rupiterrae]